VSKKIGFFGKILFLTGIALTTYQFAKTTEISTGIA
jgi:hypothetical protein